MAGEIFILNDGDGIGFQYQFRRMQIEDTHRRLTSTLERTKPTPDTVDALYSLATNWHAGVNFDSPAITPRDRAIMQSSLRALSHHARTEYVSTVLRRLVQIASRFIETPQEVNISENKIRPPFGVDIKGLREIFQFMSDECQSALEWGTNAGVSDICTVLQQKDVSLLDAATQPVDAVSNFTHVNARKKIHTLPTAITGVDMTYTYGEGATFPRLSLVVNPLE